MRRGLLASALFLLLIVQAATFGSLVPAYAQSEWTGTVDGSWDVIYGSGTYRQQLSHHADITFTVSRDGTVTGRGTGWEHYRYTNANLPDSTCDTGRVNVTFDITGRYDKRDGFFYFKFENISPREHISCYGYTPFGEYVFIDMELKDGAVFTPDAPSTFRNVGRWDGGGELVIHGEGPPAECPRLAFEVIFPPASDPRNIAGPTDTASYTFFVSWWGTVPARVNFDIEGGTESVTPNFVFNPASMQTSPITVIMDVATYDADPGEYPLTVDAWVVDPDTGLECHAVAVSEVILVVSEDESRASDLGLVKRFGEVQVTDERTDVGGQAAVIQTGKDGAVTFNAADKASDDTVSLTTIDVNNNTAIKQYDHVDYFAKVLQDKAKTAEVLAWTDNDLLKYKEPGAWERIKASVQELVKDVSLKDKAFYSNLLSCLFALDVNTMEICGGQSMVYVSNGDLHLAHRSAAGEAAERVIADIESKAVWEKLLGALATPNVLIIPKGTELAVNVRQSTGSSTTTVTMLEGSAIVVDLASEKVQLVNAGERYKLETTFAGQTARSVDNLESISLDSVPHWWKIQIGDYATERAIESGGGGLRSDVRTSVFSAEEYGVIAWVELHNVPYQEEHLVEFSLYPPDGSPPRTINLTIKKGQSNEYEYWAPFDRSVFLPISGYQAAEKLGQWKVKVHYDGDFVKEFPFYITKNTLMKNQYVTYTVVSDVKADSAEIEAAFENNLAQGFISDFAGAGSISGIDDIEWIKTTVLDTSIEGELQDTLKIRGKDPISGESRSLIDKSLSSFIPTIGIDEDLVIPANLGGGSELMPSQLVFDKMVDLNIAGSNIKAFQFSGNKKLVEGDASSDFTVTMRYEKYTGILVNGFISGSIRGPEIGTLGLDFGVKATELSIPTSLTITSIPDEVPQNQAASVSGKTSPAVSEGQVVLTYQRNDSGDQPIKRTVPVTDGIFSDNYNMEKDGTYAVSAEYLGSGAYLSSTTDAKTLTVTPSGCLIATAAFGSELTPQVQFLRSFRENHILSTAAGSSFMNAFNAWYYSFSPSVADYEREQPWLQTTVRTAIYPLLGILTISEKAYSSMPGDYGAVAAGVVASSMIGAVYFWPAGLAVQRFNRGGKKTVNVLMVVLMGLAVGAVSISLLVVYPAALTISTSLLVLSIIAISALFSARAIGCMIRMVSRKN